ncbi:MAG: hypothetical protein ACOYOZ_17360 [Pirellula sp.]
MIENRPANEDLQIQEIADLMVDQLKKRYPGNDPVLRGVHAKSHGCVSATFEVVDTGKPELRVGVLSEPGRVFKALVRFSNAATFVNDDSPKDSSGAQSHGSRGMAIKILEAAGPLLEPDPAGDTQDFLMINSPVFAFANVEDYVVLSRVLLASIDPTTHGDDASGFFKQLLAPSNTNSEQKTRAQETLGIVGRIRSLAGAAGAGPFQIPPASPVDNDYFGAAAFKLGEKQIMRFRCTPMAPKIEATDISKPDYLRANFLLRLRDEAAGDIVFKFEIRTKPLEKIEIDNDVENASKDWKDDLADQWNHVATLTIPCQEPLNDEQCEKLEFSPWHCTEDFRPLGGINRLRRAAYKSSAAFRAAQKDSHGSCD